MPDLEFRPTLRFILLRYLLVSLLELAAIVWWVLQRDTLSLAAWVATALLYLWPIAKHIERQRIRCMLGGGHLRYEYGIFSTTVKTVPVAKIQDVTVHRTLNQRIWGVGDLQIQTAAESGPITIVNVEEPERAAEQILAAARG